jgi:hypothetical protein
MSFHNQSELDTAALMQRSAANKHRHFDVQLSTADYNHLNKVAAANRQQILVAIGRIVAYAEHGDYDDTMVYRNGDDIEAYFTCKATSRRLVMGVVWNPSTNTFGYHT